MAAERLGVETGIDNDVRSAAAAELCGEKERTALISYMSMREPGWLPDL